jgi:hypothetical protein
MALITSQFIINNNIVTYSLKARIVAQRPAVTRQRNVNNRGMVSSAQSMPMAAHATMEYVMPSLSNNYTATEERRFLCSSCRDVISRTRWQLVS